MALAISVDDFDRAIRRFAIDNQYLELVPRKTLRLQRIKCLRDRQLFVANGNDDRNDWFWVHEKRMDRLSDRE